MTNMMDFYRYERTPCFGTCPAYEMMGFRDGLVLFNQDIPRTKVLVTRINPEMEKQLLDLLFQLVSFGDQYSEKNCYDATDNPSVRAKVKWNSMTASFQHYLGCRKAPPALKRLEGQIETLLNQVVSQEI